ncbi:hypothetical protein ACFY36_48810 [Actinoplanes sp. NPDC000266]
MIVLHDARHTSATAGADAGVPERVMQKRLGRADARTTREVYTHVLPESERKAAELMDSARRMVLDGAIAGLGGATVCSALVVDLLGDQQLGPIDLAYPAADALLVGTRAAKFAMGRWNGANTAMLMGGLALGTGAAGLAQGILDRLRDAGVVLYQPERAGGGCAIFDEPAAVMR